MPNLKISYADIGYNSARILNQDVITAPTTYALDSLSNGWDLVAGRRYYRTLFAATSAAQYIIFDLGADYTTKQNTADHFIVARGDLMNLSAGFRDVSLQRSDDGNTWTDVASTSTGATATGPRLNDYIKTFTITTAYRYWRMVYTDGTPQTFQHSKIYLGKFFTFDFDCSYSFEKIPLKDSIWYSSAGAQYFSRNDEPLYKFKFVWEFQTDATVKSFEDKIAKRMRECPVFLYTTAEHQILDNVGLLHARLTDYKVEKAWNNLNTIKATFEEELG
jgi:hypothetical protein